ncbi:hypothetical protein C8R47DRAFT_594073 [Mycena vitilis]|nr:hypothetical protein C8R47DRAFT_594073 [Mycena vitilis]
MAEATRRDFERMVRYLGLPSPTDVIAEKSASRLSISDISGLGWSILADEKKETSTIGTLWDGRTATAPILIRESAKADADIIIAHIQKVRKLYMGAAESPMVEVAAHYKLDNELLSLANTTDAESETQLLKVCLHYVAKKEDDLKWVSVGRSVQRKAYPIVDFLFSDDPLVMSDSEKETKRITEASLLSLLCLGDSHLTSAATGAISELTVERVVGSALCGIFYTADRVRILSGQKALVPSVLRPTTAFTYPDMAAVRCRSSGTRQLEPAVVVAEAKVRLGGIKDAVRIRKATTPSKMANPRAQMAAAVHSTLILLVIAHCLNPNTAIKAQDIPAKGHHLKFDEKSMVYGIYYDEEQVRVYIHFPQIECVKQTYVVRFYQIQIASFPLQKTTFMSRWQLALSLFCVQKHADMILACLGETIAKYPVADLEEEQED